VSKLKKTNLLTEPITINKGALVQALSSNKEFAITLNSELKFPPFKANDIFIFQGSSKTLEPSNNEKDLLGKNYQITEEGDCLFIKAADAWPQIKELNLPNCDYDDTQAEGANEFSNQMMEDMSWMLVDFDVTYKEMIDFLEENLDITLLGVEDKASSKFSAMGYFDDIIQAQKLFFDFAQDQIKDKLANDPDYTYDYLDEDQREAVAYFKAR